MQYILFDLDGTLTDSAPGIVNGVSFALSRFGIQVEDREALARQFVGPPLSESFPAAATGMSSSAPTTTISAPFPGPCIPVPTATHPAFPRS